MLTKAKFLVPLEAMATTLDRLAGGVGSSPKDLLPHAASVPSLFKARL